MPDSGKKILLLHLYSNGDCLYATAVARQIKQDFPGCHLTWDIASFCKDIIALNPYVDHIRVVSSVEKNDIRAFTKYKKSVLSEKKKGIWDEVFITSPMENNIAYYDGTIRGMIFRAYPGKITVPVQPVLVLSEQEKTNVARFASAHRLHDFKNVILWEYSPMSGQISLDRDSVWRMARQILAEIPSTCIVLSSANHFESEKNIIDASSLTVRENAELSRYCHLLIGCSSGITWLSTSSAGKSLPMIQLLNTKVPFRNIPSIDFRRYGISSGRLVEMTKWKEEDIVKCAGMMLREDFAGAKKAYDAEIRESFRNSARIAYNLLVRLQFRWIIEHARVMHAVYGYRAGWILSIFFGILKSPFKLIRNTIKKSISRRKRN